MKIDEVKLATQNFKVKIDEVKSLQRKEEAKRSLCFSNIFFPKERKPKLGFGLGILVLKFGPWGF